jgi:hypothetical protein
MIDDDAYVELAKFCTGACHVLKTATGGRDVGSLSGPSKEQIEDLGRCVDPAKPSPLTIISDIRTVRHIESVARERANCARDLREYHPGPTKECLVAWRAEIREILGFFDVRGYHLTVPHNS